MSNFENFKSEAEKNATALKQVSLKKLNINEDLFKSKVIRLDNQIISVSDNFINKLFKILNLSPHIKNKFEEVKRTDVLSEIVDKVKDAIDKSGNFHVYLVANPSNEKLVNIVLPEKFNRITNASLVNVVEDICDRYGLEISDYNFDQDGYAVVNLKTDNQIEFDDGGGFEDEAFKFGLTLQQTDLSTQVTEFAMRMICSNGMFGPSGLTGNGPIFKFGNNSRFGNLLGTLDKLSTNKFIPQGFHNRMKEAHQCKSSLNELEYAYNWMKNSLIKNNAEPTMIETYEQYILQNYAGDLMHLQNQLKNRNQMPESMPVETKRQIKSNTSVWNLINNLTHFGTHKPVPMKDKTQKDMQMAGGKLFASAWDAETSNEILNQL